MIVRIDDTSIVIEAETDAEKKALMDLPIEPLWTLAVYQFDTDKQRDTTFARFEARKKRTRRK